MAGKEAKTGTGGSKRVKYWEPENPLTPEAIQELPVKLENGFYVRRLPDGTIVKVEPEVKNLNPFG